MITNNETAKSLAQRILDSGHKGFLIVVFPEGGYVKPEEVSFATNANNVTVLEVIEIVNRMLVRRTYKQEIIGDTQSRLPE